MRRYVAVFVAMAVAVTILGGTATADRAVVGGIGQDFWVYDLDLDRGWIYASIYERLYFIEAKDKEVFGKMELADEIEFVKFDPSSGFVYVGTSEGGRRPSRGKIYVIDPKRRAVVTTIRAGRIPNAAAVDPVHDRLYVANFRSQTISIIDTRTHSIVATSDALKRFDHSPVELAVNSRDELVYISTALGVVYAIDGRSGRLVHRRYVADWLDWPDIGFDPVSERVFVTGFETEAVFVLTSTLEPVTKLDLGPFWPETLAVDPERRLLYVATEWDSVDGGDNPIDVIDLDSYKTLERVPSGAYPGELVLDPERWRTYMGGGGGGIVVVSEDSVAPTSVLWPQFRYTYANGELLEGETTDNVSGVRAVTITYRSALGTERVRANLDCRDRAQRFCLWTAPTPELPGVYEVAAAGVDHAGSRENPGDTMTMVRLP